MHLENPGMHYASYVCTKETTKHTQILIRCYLFRIRFLTDSITIGKISVHFPRFSGSLYERCNFFKENY